MHAFPLQGRLRGGHDLLACAIEDHVARVDANPVANENPVTIAEYSLAAQRGERCVLERRGVERRTAPETELDVHR